MSANSDSIPLVDHTQWQRNQAYNNETLAPLFHLLEQVKDPEIPALSIWDMGILRDINIAPGNNKQEQKITVVITPTYSGCPAMDLIREDILRELAIAGYQHVEIKTQLSPVWTTAWISDEAKTRMAQSGIAAPEPGDSTGIVSPQCPVCGSRHSHVISEFSSTACKALYRCDNCLEPFDYFKAF